MQSGLVTFHGVDTRRTAKESSLLSTISQRYKFACLHRGLRMSIVQRLGRMFCLQPSCFGATFCHGAGLLNTILTMIRFDAGTFEVDAATISCR